MKIFGLKSVSVDKSMNNLFFFDLRDGEIPPMKLITLKALNKFDVVKQLQNMGFCVSIGLGDWLFEQYSLHEF